MNYNVQKNYDKENAENQTQHDFKAIIANTIVEQPSHSPSEEFSRKVGIKIYKEYQYPKWLNEDIVFEFSRSWMRQSGNKNSWQLDLRNQMVELNPELNTIKFDIKNTYLLSYVFAWIASKFEISDIEYYLALKNKNKDFILQEIQKYKWDNTISLDEISIIRSSVENTYKAFKNKMDWRYANIYDFGNIVIWLENGDSDSQILSKLQDNPEELFLLSTHIYQYKTGDHFGFKISPKTFFTKLIKTPINK